MNQLTEESKNLVANEEVTSTLEEQINFEQDYKNPNAEKLMDYLEREIEYYGNLRRKTSNGRSPFLDLI